MSRFLFKINGTEVPCCPFYCFNIQSEKWKLKRQGAGVGGKKNYLFFLNNLIKNYIFEEI